MAHPGGAAAEGGRIRRIDVRNFKSYKGEHAIGPFDDAMTSVIGPNGSGKSNLMDAISFVVGVKSAHLRSAQLSELVHTGETHAYVALVFVPPGANAAEIVFKRAIANGSATYSIDGKTVTAAAYLDMLASFGVLTKTRNFLVFQGDVEQVATRGPKELMAMFEHIGGADTLIPKYDELEASCASLEQESQYAHGKRKGIALEKRQKKEQRDEAEHYATLKEELAGLRGTLALTQLCYSKAELAGVRRALGTAQASVEAARAERIAPLEKERDESVGKRKKLQASQAATEKRQKAVATEVAKLRPAKLQAKEQAARLERSTKRDAEALKRKEDELKAHESDVAKFGTDLQKIQDALKELDDSASAGDAATLQLQEQHVAEYQRLKQVAGSRTFRLKQELATLQRSLQAADAERARVQQQAADLNEQSGHLAQRREKQEAARATLAKQRTELKASIDKLKGEKQALVARVKQEAGKREKLERMCEELEERYRDARADMKLGEAESQQRLALDNLCRLYPDTIYGRMTDCISVTQRKYHMPVTVVMGRNMDAILVEDEATAKGCIAHLREQRLPPMTFLPVTTIHAKPLDTRLRSLGGTARLMMDVVAPNPATVKAHPDASDLPAKFERAARYAIGNTVVCDTLEEAKRLCFGGAGADAAASAPGAGAGPRVKAVDLDGTKIDKSGVMTGGTMHSLANRAGRWSEQETEALRKERAAAHHELRTVPSAAQHKAAEDELSRTGSNLQQQLGYVEKDLANATKAIETADREAATLEKERGRTASQAETSAAAHAKAAADVSAKEAQLRAELDDVYADFSRKVGVSNIAEYEEKHFSQVEAIAAQRSKLLKQVAALQTQIDYERKRELPKHVEERRKKLAADQKEAEKLHAKLAKAEKAMADHAAEEKELADRAGALAKEAEALDTAVADAKKKLAAEQTKLAAVGRSVAALQMRGEEVALKVRAVLENAEMESVELPHDAAGAGAGAGAGGKRAPKRRRRGGDDDGDVQMEDADGADDGAASGTFEGEAANHAVAELARYDYAGVPSELLALCASRRAELATSADGAPPTKAADAFGERIALMQEDVSERAAALGKLAPNLKASEQYEALADQEHTMAAEADELRGKLRAAQDAFAEVKEERRTRILEAFNAVSGKIDSIYKALTQSTAHPLGGTAYLTLEDDGTGSDEPHKGGCKYTAMPPTKRFRDMLDLSGGERTVAALALLFAIHAYQPSPFFVLDEVDAALDGENVTRVAKYIRARSTGSSSSSGASEPSFQSIVISLKDAFYEHANSLVGVTKDAERRSSRSYTFNLDAVAGLAAGGA